MPLWAQVLGDLERRLDVGEFAQGFPTDIELVGYYDVSRHTAREAVRRLQERGVVSRQRGRGTYVTTPPIEQGVGAIYSLFRSIEAKGLEQRSEVIDLAEVTDQRVAAELGLGDAEGLIRLERLRLADGVPLAHDVAWLPAVTARPLLDADFGHTALYDELATRCDLRLTSGSEHITTELPQRHERQLLGIGAKQPVFRIRRRSMSGPSAVEWRETLVRGDRFAFTAQWSPSGSYEASVQTSVS